MKQVLFTQEGFNQIKKELGKLQQARPAAVLDLQKAREMGDLSENGYYKASRAKLSSIDAQVRKLRYIVQYAKVVQPSSVDRIEVGSKVELVLENQSVSYTIVGEYEADPKLGKISYLSPLGSALLQKRKGDTIFLNSPAGEKSYKISKILPFP